MKLFSTIVFSSSVLCSLFGQTTQTFNYTGSVQTFVVPASVFSVTVDASGAKGADLGTASGGLGGRVQGIIAVNPGDQLNIYVGGAGISSLNMVTSIFDGGGGVYSYSVCGVAGTGGGGTDIRLNGNALSDRVLVAGGGGGAGGASSPVQYCAGGNGGGLTGASGVPWNTWPQSGGGGGTQSAGGTGGIACCSCPQYTTGGTLGVGGSGSGDCAGGGGGGGGYFGGGGSCFGGAGGGSSYTGINVSSVTHTQGYQNGNGIVILSYTLSTGENGYQEALSPAQVFPNPFNSYLTLELPAYSGAAFSISDLGGRVLMSGTIPEKQLTLDAAEFPEGILLLSIHSSEGILVKKLVCYH